MFAFVFAFVFVFTFTFVFAFVFVFVFAFEFKLKFASKLLNSFDRFNQSSKLSLDFYYFFFYGLQSILGDILKIITQYQL